MLVSDFEATTDADDCRVWGWGIADTNTPDEVAIGHEITEWVEVISSFRNAACYFHNLKYDGHFILYWLLTNGYSHVSGSADRAGTFSTLIGGMGQFYSITVRWLNGNKTEFRDSLKKFPGMSVAYIAKSWGFEEGKGDIDYDAPRPTGYTMTVEERDYIRRDVSIVAKAIANMHDNKMSGLTIAGDSLSTYKRMTTKFRDTFPVLTHAMDAEIRRAYRGGFTYADDRHRGNIVGEGIALDVNSLYPYVMRTMELPYGVPVFREREPDSLDELCIFGVTFTATLKPNHIPCIQLNNNGSFTAAKYLTEITEPTEMVVTNIDWKLYNDHYDIDVLEYTGCWELRSANGFFDGYIDHWMRVKEHSTGGIRAIAKLMLNSLYGKFATNPDVAGKYPVLEDDIVRLKTSHSELRDPIYTPMGVFITSYARDLTIRACQRNYDRFLYADTDSMHLSGKEVPDNIEIHPSKIGAWKYEYDFERALYIRPKAYLEQHADGSYTVAMAGLPKHASSKLTIEDIQDGAVFHGKLRPMSVPGGIVLTPTPYRIVT